MPRTIHISDWVHKATPDYYTLFIQAWIPYNAWYNAEIAPVAGKHDFECINYICDHPNIIKDRIIVLLTSETEEGEFFRRNIAALHRLLLQHPIPNGQNQISFSTIPQGNMAQLIQQGDYYNYHYKIERTPIGQTNSYTILVEDKSTHVTKYSKQINNNQDFELVESDVNFQQLTQAIQNKIRYKYAIVNPKAPYDIVVAPLRRGERVFPPTGCMIMDDKTNVYFVNETDKIARVIVKLIYRLRCELFHGSIALTQFNQMIFKYLYNIQSALIQELV